MAGFDYEFTFDEEQRSLVDACLAAAKRRARALRISWRVEAIGECALRCTINGNSRRTDLLCLRLERDLPTVCEGIDTALFPPARRRAIGLGFVNLLLLGRDTRYDGIGKLRAVRATNLYYSPFDIADESIPAELRIRLRVTELVIESWYFEEMPAPVLLEELHTACELLLEHLVNRRAKRLSFSQLVARAEKLGFLDDPFAGIADAGSECRSVPSERLIELKDHRKEARHRGDLTFEPWLREHWEEVAMLIERLSDRCRLSGKN